MCLRSVVETLINEGLVGCVTVVRHVVPVSLQIATFFSNNLDFFTSSGYSPRGCTGALNPLQAECMLSNKKKAAAFIHAVRKVGESLLMIRCVCILCLYKLLSGFSRGRSPFRTETPCPTGGFSPAPRRVEKVSPSRYDSKHANVLLEPLWIRCDS